MTSNNSNSPDDFVADLIVYKGDDSRRRRDHYTEADTEIEFRLSYGFRALQAVITLHLRRTLPFQIGHDLAVKFRPITTTTQTDYVVLNEGNFVDQISSWYHRQKTEPRHVGVPLFVYICDEPSPSVLSTIAHTVSEMPEGTFAPHNECSDVRLDLLQQAVVKFGKRTHAELEDDNQDDQDDASKSPCCKKAAEWQSIPVRFHNSDEIQLEIHIPTLKRILSLSQ